MSKEDAKWWGNYLFKVGWFCFMTSWLAMMATFLFGALTVEHPFLAGYPPMWMMVPSFAGMILIFVSIAIEEIGGVWKHD